MELKQLSLQAAWRKDTLNTLLRGIKLRQLFHQNLRIKCTAHDSNTTLMSLVNPNSRHLQEQHPLQNDNIKKMSN